MVDKNNWRFHTANKYFIKSREYPEKVFWSKDWAQFLSDCILSDYRNLDRLSSCEMTDLFTLKLVIILHWNDCVCWHQPSQRKRTKILARQIFLISNKYILWGMQVDMTASGLKDAKKRGDLGMVWLHLPTNPLQRCSFILAIALILLSLQVWESRPTVAMTINK